MALCLVCLFVLAFLFLFILVYCHKCFNYPMTCHFSYALSLFLFDLGAAVEFSRLRAEICSWLHVSTLLHILQNKQLCMR